MAVNFRSCVLLSLSLINLFGLYCSDGVGPGIVLWPFIGLTLFEDGHHKHFITYTSQFKNYREVTCCHSHKRVINILPKCKENLSARDINMKTLKNQHKMLQNKIYWGLVEVYRRWRTSQPTTLGAHRKKYATNGHNKAP